MKAKENRVLVLRSVTRQAVLWVEADLCPGVLGLGTHNALEARGAKQKSGKSLCWAPT